MITLSRVILVIIVLLSGASAWSQNDLISPDEYFKNKHYDVAYTGYKAIKKIDKDKGAMFNLAIAAYHTNRLSEANKLFNSLLGKKHRARDCNFYLGRIAHAQSNFKQAIVYYKDFLRTGRGDDRRASVVAMIKQCATGIKLSYKTQVSYVENLGEQVNSANDEIACRQSPSMPNKFYFSSNRPGSTGGMRGEDGRRDHNFGQYKSDIYYATNVSGNWRGPNPLHSLLNTAKDDVLLDFSDDGQSMIYTKGLATEDTDIYLDTFTQDSTDLRQSLPLESKMIGNLGDAYVQIFNDSTYLFSSRRTSGYGAYDIYVMAKRQGVWLEPINLGERINSEFDEISPFLTKDGTKLYFSSNNYKSMGGFDVFVSEYDTEEAIWSVPENLGAPVNSPNDDSHFIVVRDGMSCMFSSNRKTSVGGYDLYISYLREQERHQLFDQRGGLAFLSISQDDIEREKLDPEVIAKLDNNVDTVIPIDTVDAVVAPVQTKDFNIGTLLYGEDEVILTPNNITELNTVAEMMALYPEVKLDLHGHCSYQGNPSFELYFSIKRAEKAYQYLVEKDVPADRINIKGFGSFYPKVLETGLANNPLERMNRRIELHFSDVDNARLTIKEKSLNIPERFLDRRKDTFLAANTGLSYRIEIARVGQMYQNNGLRFFDDVVVARDQASSDYVYTIGIHKSYAQAVRQREELVRNNLPQAAVKPFVDGKLMENANLVDASEQYPDLLNYLKDIR